jgi:predicted alpha/beta superfamily hydrolase
MAWTTQEVPVVCERTGLAHVVSVGLPVRHESLDEMPLLLCLDGPWMFGTTLDATRIMSMSKEAPEAAVIGLSFADTSMGEYLRQRARWYTPTPWVPPEITGVKGMKEEESGRADELLTFITEQLLPTVEADHLGGTAVSERWLIGHSFSALFGLRALFTAPEAFDKWLLASPSIWWDDRAVLAIEEDYAAAHDDLSARVFASYGELEDVIQPIDGISFNMGGNVEDLVSRLTARNYPGLSLSHAVIAGDAHASVIGAAISKGLRALL